jgi:hypothetical protein
MPCYGKTPVVATRLNLKNRSDDLWFDSSFAAYTFAKPTSKRKE